ncbi:MAG: TldD/PmbA family protein [Myxococcota bacterium]
MSDLLKFAQEAVEKGKAAGAQGVWASASKSRSVDFQHRDGKLEKVQESASRGLNVQVWVDGRYSSASTTDFARLDGFLAEVIALTRALQPDPARELPDPKLFEGRAAVELELTDPAVAAVTEDERLAALAEMDQVGHGHSSVLSVTTGWSTEETWQAMASSNGFAGTHAGTQCWYGCDVTVKDEGDKRPEGWHWVGGRWRAGLPAPKAVAEEALQNAILRLGATKGPTRKGLLIVDPRAGGNLVNRLLSAANAQSVQQGRSFWADRIGKKAVSDKLTVTDDPLLVRGLASRLFDGEGIAAKAMPVIDKGALANLYVDTYYGKKASMSPTTGSPSNRVIAPGKRDLAAVLGAAKQAVYVTSWLGGNHDPTTGDFSLGLRGHLVEKGKVGAPIGEMNVTGNLIDLFAGLVEVGNDPWPYASLRTPTLVFDGVSFSGA